MQPPARELAFLGPGAALPLPEGFDEPALRAMLDAVRVADGDAEELRGYCREDFRRFVLTWGLVRELGGRALELGANPYFTTVLLREFTPLDVTLANYFGSPTAVRIEQAVSFRRRDGVLVEETFRSDGFNVEADRFPYADATFDVALFCEIVEHLTNDPLAPLLELRRVLRPGGVLIVTTPNVARLENVARLAAGNNIYDPYSAYGPYGRHNREYTLRELRVLLAHAGFRVERAFTADVHDNRAARDVPPRALLAAAGRRRDLGQYLFVRAVRAREPSGRRPRFLYR